MTQLLDRYIDSAKEVYDELAKLPVWGLLLVLGTLSVLALLFAATVAFGIHL